MRSMRPFQIVTGRYLSPVRSKVSVSRVAEKEGIISLVYRLSSRAGIAPRGKETRSLLHLPVLSLSLSLPLSIVRYLTYLRARAVILRSVLRYTIPADRLFGAYIYIHIFARNLIAEKSQLC